jgi:hypothetical protein
LSCLTYVAQGTCAAFLSAVTWISVKKFDKI